MSSLALNFSSGADEGKVRLETQRLLDSGWNIDAESVGLEKSFQFPSFARALDYICTVGVECKIKNHHAELRNTYKTVYLHWTTHVPKGLSEKDTTMAGFCEETARRLGALQEGEGGVKAKQ